MMHFAGARSQIAAHVQQTRTAREAKRLLKDGFYLIVSH